MRLRILFRSADDEKTEDDSYQSGEEYCARDRVVLEQVLIKKCVLISASQTGYGIKSYREIEVVNNALGSRCSEHSTSARYMNHLKIKDILYRFHIQETGCRNVVFSH